MVRNVAHIGIVLLLAALAGARSVRGDDGTDDASSDDLLVSRRAEHGKLGRGGWEIWWYANRAAILKPSYRASAGEEPPPRQDPAVRGRARTALLAALGSRRELVRSEAALALGRMGDVRDVATLAKIVSDPDVGATRRTHRWAALALGMLPRGDEEQAAAARRALLAALDSARGQRDHFAFFWANCAYALAMRGDDRAFPDLARLRREGVDGRSARTSLHADVLGAICYAIGVLGGELAIPEIVEHLKGARAPDGGAKDTSWAACHALARIPGARSIALLRKAARDDRIEVRRVALAVLGAVAGPDDDVTADLLRKTLAEADDAQTREMAILALGRTGHPTAGPVLLALRDRAHAADRTFVDLALGLRARRKPDPAIRTLLAKRLVGSNDQEETTALCIACGLAGASAARKTLADLAGGSNPAVAAQACYALGLLGGSDPMVKATLLDAAGRPGNFMVEREASLALGLLRDRAVVARLEAVASSGKRSDLDRAAAAVCLGRVGDDREIDFYLGLLADRTVGSQLRACVLHGLGLLLDRSEGASLAPIAADSLWFESYRGQMVDPIRDLQRLAD